ncbi:MAG TPA: hypothetical protein VF601_23515 [Beijerinckiaceae bacterium]|jgi:hypothetical protein
MFFRGSRYEHVPEAEFAGRDGRTIRYKRMRFIPEARGALATIVREGDRPDLVAYTALGDPEQFWRLCDVNRIQRPADLTREPGRRIQVPGPEGG